VVKTTTNPFENIKKPFGETGVSHIDNYINALTTNIIKKLILDTRDIGGVRSEEDIEAKYIPYLEINTLTHKLKIDDLNILVAYYYDTIISRRTEDGELDIHDAHDEIATLFTDGNIMNAARNIASYVINESIDENIKIFKAMVREVQDHLMLDNTARLWHGGLSEVASEAMDTFKDADRYGDVSSITTTMDDQFHILRIRESPLIVELKE
jgi:hypothetical protein